MRVVGGPIGYSLPRNLKETYMRLGALIGLLSPEPQSTDLAEQAKRYAGEGFDSLWMAQAIGRGFMIPDQWLGPGREQFRARFRCSPR